MSDRSRREEGERRAARRGRAGVALAFRIGRCAAAAIFLAACANAQLAHAPQSDAAGPGSFTFYLDGRATSFVGVAAP